MSTADDEEVLVGRCYTKARRHPSMIGQWEGHRLWGGPYTVPQFATMAVVFGALILLLITVPALWATFGLFNLGALVVLPYLASLLVRRLHVSGGRNPFVALASVVGLLAGGQRRRLAGRPLPRITTQPLLGTATLTQHPPRQRVAPLTQQVVSASGAPRVRRAHATPSGTGSAALAQLAAHRLTAPRNQR
ncbi:phage holin family protein [Streptomyces drozdowiczii]|uniref:phage holin family protein n=1 Tax=Streptomyces drozdowiczii TaxID=202862 RepID=UPI00403C62EE